MGTRPPRVSNPRPCSSHQRITPSAAGPARTPSPPTTPPRPHTPPPAPAPAGRNPRVAGAPPRISPEAVVPSGKTTTVHTPSGPPHRSSAQPALPRQLPTSPPTVPHRSHVPPHSENPSKPCPASVTASRRLGEWQLRGIYRMTRLDPSSKSARTAIGSSRKSCSLAANQKPQDVMTLLMNSLLLPIPTAESCCAVLPMTA